jgi:glycosyltransferase involved in cell wall biosynthesis
VLGIVIPYYKLSFFEETLQSLANQSDKRFKVYIGDDASTENPKDLLDKFTGKFNFTYQRFTDNLGGQQLVKQWERCVDLLQNEVWFVVLGDDDVLGDNYVEEFYKYLPDVIEEKCKVVRFATVVIDGMSNQISSTYTHSKLEKSTDFFYRRFTNKTRSSLSEYVFKRSAYKTYGFYNYKLAWFTDDRAWLEFSEFKTIYSINSAVVSFRLSKENISRHDYKLQEKANVSLQFFKFIITKHLLKFTKQQQRHFTLYYEQLVYKYSTLTFYFWLLVIFAFLKQLNIVQCVKFTRRMFIQLKRQDD